MYSLVFILVLSPASYFALLLLLLLCLPSASMLPSSSPPFSSSPSVYCLLPLLLCLLPTSSSSMSTAYFLFFYVYCLLPLLLCLLPTSSSSVYFRLLPLLCRAVLQAGLTETVCWTVCRRGASKAGCRHSWPHHEDARTARGICTGAAGKALMPSTQLLHAYRLHDYQGQTA